MTYQQEELVRKIQANISQSHLRMASKELLKD